MNHDLRFEAVYPYPPERVWRALTEPDELAQWLMVNDFAPELGHKFHFLGQRPPGVGGKVNCEVIDVEAPRRLAYKWLTADLETVVRFFLEPTPSGGTRLVLEHSGFQSAGGMMISVLLTWKRKLRETLPQIFEGGSMVAVECNMDAIGALVMRYEAGIEKLCSLITGIPPDILGIAAADGEWSAHETALHIVDAEIVGAMRLRMIAAQPGSKLASFAGDVWGRELAYPKQPLAAALGLFRELRQVTASMLRLLPPSAWLHRAEHEEAGEVTLESYLDSHCEHAEIHMEEIEDTLSKLTARSREGRVVA